MFTRLICETAFVVRICMSAEAVGGVSDDPTQDVFEGALSFAEASALRSIALARSKGRQGIFMLE